MSRLLSWMRRPKTSNDTTSREFARARVEPQHVGEEQPTERESSFNTMNDSHRKVACITGAGGGVAQALALALARDGYDLMLVGRREASLKLLADRVIGEAHAAVRICLVDISDASQVLTLTQTARSLGGLDVLINAAVVFSEASLSDIKVADLIAVIDTIVKGTLLVSKELLPLLGQRQGHILTFVSDWALPGWAGPTPFTTAKWALAGMGESLGKEAISLGVKVCNIFPGDIASHLDPDASIPDVAREFGSSKIPLSDIVATVRYILALRLARVQSLVILPTDPDYVS